MPQKLIERAAARNNLNYLTREAILFGVDVNVDGRCLERSRPPGRMLTRIPFPLPSPFLPLQSLLATAEQIGSPSFLPSPPLPIPPFPRPRVSRHVWSPFPPGRYPGPDVEGPIENEGQRARRCCFRPFGPWRRPECAASGVSSKQMRF